MRLVYCGEEEQQLFFFFLNQVFVSISSNSCRCWLATKRSMLFCWQTCSWAWARKPFSYWVSSVHSSAVCLFASVPQLKPWCSPDIGWQGSVCSHFLTHVHTVVHTSAVLPTSVTAALQPWRYLCSKISAKDLRLDGPTLLNATRKLWLFFLPVHKGKSSRVSDCSL